MKNVLGVFFVVLCLISKAQNPPDITLIFYLDENAEEGTLVGKVSATDPEGDPLTYSITSGNDAGAFSIDGSEGDISVANQALLDFETTPAFNMMVQADDGNGGVTTADITINLVDIIDENPLALEEGGGFEIYPNPASNFLFLNVDGTPSEELKLQLYTSSGNQIELALRVKSKSTDVLEIDLANLVAGIYLLKFETKTAVVTRSILIK